MFIVNNRNGFTLVEVLGVLVLISVVFLFVVRSFSTTMSLGKEESYRVMKENIISISYVYVEECMSGTIMCDFSFDENNIFPVRVLKENGYFKNLVSPIDGKELDECLKVEVTRNSGGIVASIIDDCY